MNRSLGRSFSVGILGKVGCLVLAAACSRSGSSADDEVLGISKQAVTNGVNDDSGLDANTVVALENPSRPGVACSGALITPLVVLTASECVDPSRAGPTPNVRVGADLTNAKTFAATGSDVMTGPKAAHMALVYLDPNHPVLEEAKTVRQEFFGPPPLPADPSAPDTAYDFVNMGIAGWSPLDANGQPRPNATVRQIFTRDVMRTYTADGETSWVRDVTNKEDGALSEGDLGAPLFVTDHAGVRQVQGIATKIGVAPSAALGCPSTAQRCDFWEDVPSVEPWMSSKLQLTLNDRTPKWFSAHYNKRGFGFPSIPDWWLGEVDYTGECQPALDADCDHWYDYELDDHRQPTSTVRDNCLGWWNPDQLDSDDDGVGDVCDHCATIPKEQTTSPVWKNRAPGSELGPSKRYPTPDETMEAKFPGDACRTVARAELLPMETRFEEDPQSSRTLSWSGLSLKPRANNFFTLQSSVNRGGTHLGYTRAMSCACAEGSADECVVRDGLSPLCPADQMFGEGSSRWHPMHVADSTQPAASRGEVSDADGLVFTTFSDIGVGGPATQTWSWRYWLDTPGVKPVSFSPSKDVPVPVFEGVTAVWVKNFAPQAEQAPERSTVSDAANASERIGLTYSKIQEIVNRPESVGIPTIELPQFRGPLWPIDPVCPNCVPGGILIGRNPLDEVILQGPAGQNLAARSVLDASVIRSLVTPQNQVVFADQGEANVSSGSRGAVLDLRTGLVTSALSLSAGNGRAVVRSASSAPMTMTAERGVAAPRFLGPALSLPAGAAAPHAATMSAKRDVLLDFGTSWSGERAKTLQQTHLATFAAGTSEVVGLESIVAAAWREHDPWPYVLELTRENDAPVVRLVQVAQVGSQWQPSSVVASWPMTSPALYAMTSNYGSLVVSVVREEGFFLVVLDDPTSAPPERMVKGIYQGQGTLAVPAEMRSHGQLFYGVLHGESVVPVLADLPGGSGVSRTDGLVSVDVSKIRGVF